MPCIVCKKAILINDLLTCKDCKVQFHHQCIDISKAQYKDLSDSDRKIWQCQGCRNISRRNRNDDTPIGKSQKLTQLSTELYDESRESITKKTIIQPSPLTREDVREEMLSILSVEMAKMRSDIKSTMESHIKIVMEEVSALKNSMDFINAEFEDIKSTLKTSSVLTKQLEKENVTLRAKLADLDSRIGQMEQHSRSNNLEIQCVPEFRNENLVSTIMQLSKVVESNTSESDIQHCTRIAKLKANSDRPRSIVVQFARPAVRDGLLAAVAKYNKAHKTDKLNSGDLGIAGEKKPIYVVEHLSATNKSLHAAARVKAKELKYKFVWVKHGKIYVRRDEDSEHTHIKDIESVNSLK